MSLIKWNKNNVLDTPISSMFDSLFGRDINDFLGDWKGTQPAVNVVETKDDFRVEVAAPGMAKEDFNLKLDNNILVISGKKDEKKEEKEENYMRREFIYSSFQRSFHLPIDVVDSNKIEAHYHDGILLVTVPKKEEVKKAQTPKQISVS